MSRCYRNRAATAFLSLQTPFLRSLDENLCPGYNPAVTFIVSSVTPNRGNFLATYRSFWFQSFLHLHSRIQVQVRNHGEWALDRTLSLPRSEKVLTKISGFTFPIRSKHLQKYLTSAMHCTWQVLCFDCRRSRHCRLCKRVKDKA